MPNILWILFVASGKNCFVIETLLLWNRSSKPFKQQQKHATLVGSWLDFHDELVGYGKVVMKTHEFLWL